MVTAVIGAQWGDEGKGKVIDYLSETADYAVRFHGGANAGHTVVNQYGTVRLHILPSAIFHEHTKCVIANGVVFDPKKFFEEIEEIKKFKVKTIGRVLVSPRAQVVFPYHKTLDKILDLAVGGGPGRTGTTKSGNGPVHADKVTYHGINIYDLLDKKRLHKKISEEAEIKNRIFKVFGEAKIDVEALVNEYYNYGKKLRPYLANTFKILNKAVDNKKNILFEGAHGIFLDVDWGTYPYVTASSILPSNIGAGAGVDPKKLKRVVGVIKVYVTRVDSGACPMPTELKGGLGDKIREIAGEYGATTGRPRRIGWLDLVQVKFAAKLCGLTEIAITKSDILSGFKTVKVCIGYKYKGKNVDYIDINTEALREVTPVYKELKGWKTDFSKVKKYSDLPDKLKSYFDYIERFVGVPIKIVSVGPSRNQTLLKR